MILDTSAIVAVLQREAEAPRIEAALVAAERVRLPTPAYLECCIVLAGRRGPGALESLDRFVSRYRVALVPFTDDHARLARDAFLRFGKGRHPAGLNFGDCMSYAVAKAEGLPLLFVGEDFARTDVAAA